MKTNKTMRLASALLVAVLLTTCAISGTFAKYVTAASASDTARVAKWGVSVEFDSSKELFHTEYETHDASAKDAMALSVKSSSEEKVVAPGTSGYTSFSITGKPEVACRISIDLLVNSKISLPAGNYTLSAGKFDNEDVSATITAEYEPLKWYFGTEVPGDNTDYSLTLADLKNSVDAELAEFAPNTTLDKTYYLAWKWSFEDKVTSLGSFDNDYTPNDGVNLIDFLDTYLGNEDPAQKIDLTATVQVEQIEEYGWFVTAGNYYRGTAIPLYFTSAVDSITSIEIGGQTVDASNYELAGDKNSLTLKKIYTDTLSRDSYVLTVNARVNGEEVSRKIKLNLSNPMLCDGPTFNSKVRNASSAVTEIVFGRTAGHDVSALTYKADVSANQDGSIKLYASADNKTLYVLSEGKIVANTSCSKMFYSLGITSLDLSDLDTSNVTDMSLMFYDCSNLTSLDLSNFDTSNVTNMSSMFNSCKKLTSLDLSNFDTSNVTNMDAMFHYCYVLTSLDVSNFDTSNVTNMRAMFYVCEKLTSLDVSNFDTSKVTNMSYMFGYCSGLTSLDVSNFDTSKVTNMSYMFGGYSFLTSLDLSNFDTSNVTNMDHMFSNFQKLTSLDLSNFDTSNVTNMDHMFYSCISLSSLNLSNFDTGKVTNMSYMFSNCSSLTSLDLSNFDTSKVYDMSGMFYYCKNLTSLDVSNFDTSKVTDMHYMFPGCSNLTSLDLSNFDTGNVKNMCYMFYDCTNLTSLDLSGFDTSKVTEMYYMFYQCTKLNTVFVGNGWSTAKVKNSAHMFKGCTSIKGGAGTVFNSKKIDDKTYAHIDGGTANPGYFTAKPGN